MTDNPNRAKRFDIMASLVRESAPEMTPRERADGLRRFSQSYGAMKTARRFVVPLALAGALAALFAVVVGLRWRSRSAADLTYALERGEMQGGGYIAPTTPEGAKIRFSDGTEVELGPGTRGRLSNVNADGAQIALEDGAAHARVFHRPTSKWLFHAGPFVINVTGTMFDMHWSPSEELLEVEMHEGSVIVSGPLPAGQLNLRAHEKLTVRARDNEAVIRKMDDDLGKSAPSDGSENADSPNSVAGEAPSPQAPPKGSDSAPGSLGLADLLSAGKPSEVLSRAEARGIDWCVTNASVEDLAALADAARYGLRDRIARRALTALRERFPRSSRARDAAFFLGRIAESGSPSDGLRWYEKYLEEARSGLYARDALGRKLVLVQQVSGNEKARPVAEEYLRKYPTGTYAKVARAVLDAR